MALLTECGGFEVSVVYKHRTPDGVESNIAAGWIANVCLLSWMVELEKRAGGWRTPRFDLKRIGGREDT